MNPLRVVLLLLLVTALAAQRGVLADGPAISPFRAMRVVEDGIEVQIHNDTWFALEKVAGVDTKTLLKESKRLCGRQWWKRITEDLSGLLITMGTPVANTVDLVVRDLATGESREMEAVEMTHAKRQKLRSVHKGRAPDVANAAAPAAPPIDLQRELLRLVDLPSARGRALAAEALAKKTMASLEQWHAACATFGDFAELEPGTSKQQVDLRVLGETESTEIHLFVPEGYDPHKPAPLLLWGHGAGGTGAREYLHWQQTADQIGMFVLAPTEFGRTPGWGSTPRERYGQLAALRWARRHANIDENAIFVGGVSRGGHMAWDLALRFPDLWAGVLPCIGGPRLQIGAGNNLRYLENIAHLPIRDLQGSEDDPLLLANLHLAFDRLKKLKAKDVQLHEFPDRGHSFDLAVVDWVEFFAARRDPRPRRLLRRAADLTEARAAWAEITRVERNISVKAVPRVSQAHWAKLDEAGRRALTHDRIVDLTARLAVTNKGKGRFSAQGKGVRSFELLLSSAMLGRDGAVEVRWRSRPVRTKAVPSVTVLLAEFAERFDRTFLPVVRVRVP